MKKIWPWLIGGAIVIYLVTSSKSTKKEVPGQTGGDDNTYGDTLRGIRRTRYDSV